MTTQEAAKAADAALDKDETTRARTAGERAGMTDEPAGDTVTLDLFDVEVRRSATDTVVATVPEHEIPILRALHGPKRVTKIEGAVDQRDYPASAEGEFNRLLKSYYRVNSSNPVERVYRDGPEELEEFGFTAGGDTDAGPAQSVQTDNRRKNVAAKKAAKKK